MNEEGDVRQPHGSQGDGYNGPSLPYGDPTIQFTSGGSGRTDDQLGGPITYVLSKMSNELKMNVE